MCRNEDSPSQLSVQGKHDIAFLEISPLEGRIIRNVYVHLTSFLLHVVVYPKDISQNV